MQIQHITELFSFDGETFVIEVYRYLLGRDPDESGLRYYLGRLALGYGKAGVVIQLAKSPECRPHNELIGLKPFLAEQRRAGHWLWGRWNRHAQMARIWQSGITGLGQIVQQLATQQGAINTLNQNMVNIIDQQKNLVHQISDMARQIANSLQHIPALSALGASTHVDERYISREAVRQAFRDILGREPEGEDVITHHAKFPHVQALREALMESDEFNTRLTHMSAHAQSIFRKMLVQQSYNLGV
jgi:hypothetical protein